MNFLPLTLPDPSKPIEDQDILVLFAMCIFGEARGESDLARRAVAQVVLNRATHPLLLFGSKTSGHFEANLRAVILRPSQFSSLYPGDPNYHKLWYPLAHAVPEVWERCLTCASAALAAKDRADTLTFNSDHYFDDSILPPSWASPTNQTVKIGRLNFFRLYLPHPGDSSPENAPPSSGSSPDASLRPFQRSEKTETQNSAADLSSGSHHSAKILPELATTLPASPALPLGLPGNEPAGPEETPAPGPQSPRPPMSSPAPKSLRALICGPRSYPWYGWGRRLSLLTGILFRYVLEHLTFRTAVPNNFSAAGISAPQGRNVNRIWNFLSASGISAPQGRNVNSRRFQPTELQPTNQDQPRTGLTTFSAATRPAKNLSLLALLAFALLATACSDLETTAYRVLAVTQAEYETIQDKVAESAARNLITEQQWELFQVLGHRFIAAHNSAVDAFTLWNKSKQPADTARLQAMLDLLPGLIVDINALVDSFTAPPNISPNHSPNGATIPPSTGPTLQPQLDQPIDPDPSPARVLFHPGSHGEPFSRRGSPSSSAPARTASEFEIVNFELSQNLGPDSKFRIVNSESVSDLDLGIGNFPPPPSARFDAGISAPQGPTVNSRRSGGPSGYRGQPTKLEPGRQEQPRTGLPAFSASAVRARFQPCRKSAADKRASAPEVHFASGHILTSRCGSVPSSVLQPPIAVIPRSDSDEGSAFLLTSDF